MIIFFLRFFYIYYDRGLCVQVPSIETVSIDEPHLKFIKRPISPKIKGTHWRINHKNQSSCWFLKRRFKFEIAPCVFWEAAEETWEYMVFCLFLNVPCQKTSGLIYIIKIDDFLILGQCRSVLIWSIWLFWWVNITSMVVSGNLLSLIFHGLWTLPCYAAPKQGFVLFSIAVLPK